MPNPDYTLKCDVTQDGNGFDNPATVSIRKRPNVPSKGTLTFPNLNGKFTEYFSSTDIIAVYLGLDALEPNAIIMGFPFEIGGRGVLTVGIADLMTLINRAYRRIWLRDNFDGFEATHAIKNMIEEVDQTMYSQQIDTSGIQGTNPRVILEDDLRYASLEKVLTIIKSIHSRCYDTTEYPKTPLGYTYWMQENRFNFRKMERVSEALPVIEFDNVDDLLSSAPKRSIMPLINKATVVGKSYTDGYGNKLNFIGSHTNNSIKQAHGLHQMRVTDNTLPSNWQCEQKATRIVKSNFVRNITSQISVPNLLTSIPNITIISVNDSKYGISGNNLVSALDINWGGGSTRCSATLNNVEPLLIDYL